MICRLSVILLAGGMVVPRAEPQAGGARPALERQAAGEMEAGHYANAAALFERLAKQNPEYAAYRFQAALARYQNGEYATAADSFKAALVLDPVNANAQAFLGLSEAASGRLKAAIIPLSAAFQATGMEPELRRLTGIQLATAFATG